MNVELTLRNFFLSLTTTNFDDIFYDGNTGKNIPFREVFPTGNYAVVGNSPISLEKKNGFDINKANYVVRFNNFQLTNYEYNIGTKTDIWITGGGKQAPNHIPLVADSSKQMKKILMINNSKSFKDKQLKVIEKYSSENLSSFIIFHNDALLNKFSTLLQGVPTTGFIVLLLLASKYKSINTYGFSFGSYKRKYHYYNDNVTQDYGHRWSKELEIFKIVVKKKLLKNNDFLKSTVRNTSNTFYDRNMPKHIKRLHKQRTYTYEGTIRNIPNHMNQSLNSTNPLKFSNIPNSSNYNTSVNSVQNQSNSRQNNVVDDTNNKLMEISKMLNNI